MRVMSAGTVCAALMLAASPSHAQRRYRRADVDTAGRLCVTTAAGATFAPRMDSDQVGVADPAVSPDGRSVGWLALYRNCCTTYPIALALVVRSAGHERRFHGNDLPIAQWAFLDRGRRVALSQAPLHGLVTTHYELYDVASGRRLGAYDELPDTAAESTPLGDLAAPGVPAWVHRAFARPADPLKR